MVGLLGTTMFTVQQKPGQDGPRQVKIMLRVIELPLGRRFGFDPGYFFRPALQAFRACFFCFETETDHDCVHCLLCSRPAR